MKKAVIVVGLAIAAGVGWYLLSPLFIDKTVDEAFPVFPTKEAIAEMSPEERVRAKAKALADAAAMPAKGMDEGMTQVMDAPRPARQGTFRDGDERHKGSGTAKLFELPDGTWLLRLENLDVTNGPDLHVYLAKHAAVQEADHVTDGGYLSLGDLKGNKGNQNYAVPANTDVSAYKSVVIWCELFGVLFSPASLE